MGRIPKAAVEQVIQPGRGKISGYNNHLIFRGRYVPIEILTRFETHEVKTHAINTNLLLLENIPLTHDETNKKKRSTCKGIYYSTFCHCIHVII